MNIALVEGETKREKKKRKKKQETLAASMLYGTLTKTAPEKKAVYALYMGLVFRINTVFHPF